MFKQFFKSAEEKPEEQVNPEQNKALSERITKLVKQRPDRPATPQSHLSEPVALPREPLKGAKPAEASAPANTHGSRPNERRIRDRDQSDKAPSIGTIYLTRPAFYSDDPHEVIQLNTNIISYFLFEAGYRVEELHQDAFRLYSVDYYINTALKGGHALFAKQAHGLFPTWRGVREGLEAMGAEDHHAIYQAFVAYLKEDEERAERIRSGSGFGRVDPGIKDFDEQMRRLEAYSPLAPKAAEWFKALPSVELFEPEAMEKAIRALADQPILQDRRMKL